MKKSEDKKIATKVVENKKYIVKPRMTEKASLQSNVNAYTFVVTTDATKLNLISELKREHNVTPVKVNISNLPSKRVVVRGKKGVKSGIKKATVFLKKGDTIKLS
jgi:ribosomal protein L23